jgi:hypothetical protein
MTVMRMPRSFGSFGLHAQLRMRIFWTKEEHTSSFGLHTQLQMGIF